jgi:hypothetical protein
MSARDVFSRTAQDLAYQLEAKALKLRVKLHQIEAQKREVKAEYELMRRAPERLKKFDPVTPVAYQCPRCWLLNEKKSAMAKIAGAAPGQLFRCDACGYEIPVTRA